MSDIEAPMEALLKGKVKFKWKQKQEGAFQRLNQQLVSEVTLAYPDPEKPYILYTDAPYIDIGAVLTHIEQEERVERSMGFFSRKLRKAELAYHTVENECLR